MTDQMMFEILTGPVAALALCVSAIFFIARWLAKHVPIWVDRHMKQIDNIVESHNEDRKVYREDICRAPAGALQISLSVLLNIWNESNAL